MENNVLWIFYIFHARRSQSQCSYYNNWYRKVEAIMRIEYFSLVAEREGSSLLVHPI